MKDEYTNWKKAWAAGAFLSLAGAGAGRIGGIVGPLSFGMALMCSEMLIWYIYTACASARGRYTAGSRASMAFWNLIGWAMASIAMWMCGYRPEAPGGSWYATLAMATCAGMAQAAAYRTQLLPMMLAAGTLISALGLPFYVAVTPGVFSLGWKGLPYIILVLIGNRVGAWLISAIETDPRR